MSKVFERLSLRRGHRRHQPCLRSLSPPCRGMDISGAGATFPYPIFLKWADAYEKETGIVVNYYQIGSGAGVRHVQFQIVAFGASHWRQLARKRQILRKL